jgi:ABC-type lipoprotein release transport system permease subunit
MSGPSTSRMAWRNLWRNTRRTVLTLVSIAFGLFLAILMTAMQDRAWAEMIDKAARLGSGHVVLQHPEYLDTPTLSRTVVDAERLRTEAEADPDVTRAVARITGPAMLSTAGDNAGAYLIAYDPAVEDTGTLELLDAIDQGSAFTDAGDKGIVLGARLADNLDLELGDKVVYTLMDRHGEIVSGLARVSGTVKTGSDGVDAGMALLPIDRMREVLSYEADEATVVALFADDSRISGSLAGRFNTALSGDAVALPWNEVRPELQGFISMKVGGAIFMELVVLMLVTAGIFNTLFVSVMERTREFGILLAIGWSPAQVRSLVLWEATWLALVGIAVGSAGTYPLYSYLHANGIDLTAATQGQQVAIDGVAMDMVLPVGIFPENLAIILVAVFSATLLAGVLPAWRAGQVAPVEAIKLV